MCYSYPRNTLIVFLSLSCMVVAGSRARADRERTFGGAASDRGYAIAQTLDNGFIIAGHSTSFGPGDCDAYLIKTDANMNVQWEKTYGGAGSDEYLYSVQQTHDGGYIAAGKVGPSKSVYLLKVDALGNMQWQKVLNGTRAESVRQTGDKGYILAGFADGAGGSDCLLVKTDVWGNKQWSKTYGGSGSDGCEAVLELPGGDFVAGGYTCSFGDPDGDAYLLKTNKWGTKVWEKNIGGSDYDRANALVSTADGGFALAGFTYSNVGTCTGGFTPCADAYLVKTNAWGVVQWQRQFHNSLGSYTSHGLAQLADDGFIVLSDAYTGPKGMTDFHLLKTDATGKAKWTKVFGGPKTDSTEAIIRTGGGRYVAVGKTASFGAGGYDVYVVGISPEMAIATDKPSYAPGQKLKILLDLTNRADAFNASVELWLVVGGTFPVFLGVLEPVPVGADVDFTGFPAYEEIVPAGLPANNAFVTFLSDYDTGEFLTWASAFFGVSSRASSRAIEETLSRAEDFAEQRSVELDAR